jgi:predicted AAA+ superfamily ATPase
MSKSPIVQRSMTGIIAKTLKQFPIVSITGPRQSGKTTLAHLAAVGYTYLNMEIEEHKHFAVKDPNGFLKKYNYKIILDEVQAVPSLFPYLQQHTDKQNKNGAYLLSGSQNFLLMEKISQTLAEWLYFPCCH